MPRPRSPRAWASRSASGSRRWSSGCGRRASPGRTSAGAAPGAPRSAPPGSASCSGARPRPSRWRSPCRSAPAGPGTGAPSSRGPGRPPAGWASCSRPPSGRSSRSGACRWCSWPAPSARCRRRC